MEILSILPLSDVKSAVMKVGKASGIRLVVPPAHYFLAGTETVAKRLIDAFLIRVEGSGESLAVCGGRIVEAEAYLDKTDPASHAATKVITQRNKIFYERGGVAYVFHSFGIYHCFNVIVRPRGLAGCVLVRALEPVVGAEAMAKRRGKSPGEVFDLCSGPGKICQALGINHLHTGCDLRKSELLILVPKKRSRVTIASGPRIGITKAVDLDLRFWKKNSKFVSR